MEKISSNTIQQAAIWMARLWADDVNQQDEIAFQTWYEEKPEHALAWQQLELLQEKFHKVPQSELSRKVLISQEKGLSRRHLLLLGLFTLGNLSLIFSGLAGHPGRREYVTAVGEIKTVTLSDGTVMSMNTDTSVYVDFEQSERMLYLLKGEIMISSAQDIKPFYVTTRDGKVVPIGTYFIVNQREQETIVSVYEGVVELRPMRSIQFVQLKAMQQAAFNTKGTMPIQQLSTSRALWLEHKIQATNSKLTDFIIELARYHRGVINVAPELAKYKVTGIFSINNIDKTLHHLSEILPIEITYYFKRWIYIKEKPKNLH